MQEPLTPLRSRPISEKVMSKIEPQYVERVRWYLERELHCRLTVLGEPGGYLIQFPAGTVEEIYAGQSTQWTYRTTIRLPNGVTLTKYVASPLNPTLRGQTILAFPNEILEGPAHSQVKIDGA